MLRAPIVVLEGGDDFWGLESSSASPGGAANSDAEPGSAFPPPLPEIPQSKSLIWDFRTGAK